MEISSPTAEMEPSLALSVENSYLLSIYCEQSVEGIQNKKKFRYTFYKIATGIPRRLHGKMRGSCSGVCNTPTE